MDSVKFGREQSKHLQQARAILDSVPEGEELQGERKEQYDKFMAEAKKLDGRINEYKALEAMEVASKESAGRISPVQDIEPIHKELNRYSVVRALRAQVNQKQLDGVEAEVNDELIKRYGRSPRGFFLPTEMRMPQRYADASLTTTTGAGAVHTNVLMGSFMDFLRNEMLMAKLGATVLDDLNGTVAIPKQTAATSIFWTEGSGDDDDTTTQSDITIGQVTMAPRLASGYTSYSRSFVAQTSLAVENFVRNDLNLALAHGLDEVGFVGAGTGDIPEGLLANSSVPTVALGADGGYPTYAKMVEMETTPASSNVRIVNPAYVTNAKGRGIMKTTAIAANTAEFIWDRITGQVNSTASHVSNCIPSTLVKGSYGTGLSAVIYSPDWSNAAYGLWGPTDVLIDPFTKAKDGSMIVYIYQNAMFKVKRPEAFCKIVDLKTV